MENQMAMKSKAALLWDAPGQWSVEEVDLDAPRHGEVVVEMVASGLCHSDDHHAVGIMPSVFPYCGGHEGAGIVRDVGPGVTDLVEGDHIITTFVPSCGKCRWCASGSQQFCDAGATAPSGIFPDGTSRMNVAGRPVARAGMVGTFSEWEVIDQLSCIKIRRDVPLQSACLIGCGVPTGWGAAVNGASASPGDVVIVMGCGGVGINAVQGARHAGASAPSGIFPDGTSRMNVAGRPVARAGMVGTFSEWEVIDQLSCIKIRRDVPLESACLIGCGVPTGWGAAVNGASASPGDVVIVMGCGGVGINAVQGARHAGATQIIAVDPVPFKQEMALKLGATHAFGDIEEAREFAKSITNGQGADSAIVTISVISGESVNDAFTSIRKGGTVVVTSVGDIKASGIPISLFELAMYQKRIQGNLAGMASQRLLVPRLLDLYAAGMLKLDELVTRTYRLDQINEATDDLRAGANIRGVLVYTSRSGSGL
ncbi:MAG: zinc-binding dehydrogenase [Ilumatobacteraceae bacterium]